MSDEETIRRADEDVRRGDHSHANWRPSDDWCGYQRSHHPGIPQDSNTKFPGVMANLSLPAGSTSIWTPLRISKLFPARAITRAREPAGQKDADAGAGRVAD